MPDASCLMSVALTMAVAAGAAAQTPAAGPPACPTPSASTPYGDVLNGWAASPVTRGATAPRLVQQHQPRYTSDAMRAEIEGTVMLQALVGADGLPADICIARSLDAVHGLDAQAAAALRAWRFSPGPKDGAPVPVRVSIEMAFALPRSGRAQVAERMAAEIAGVFYDQPAHGFRLTLLPIPDLVERKTHCFVPVPPERRAHVAQTMAVYVQPTRLVDDGGNGRQKLAADEPWLVVRDSGDGHVIFDQALGDCRDAPPAGPAVPLLRDQPATPPQLIKAGDFNTTGATKPGDKGHVEVEFTVLPDGRTADLRVSRSVGARPAVEAAALAAARATTYKPATKGGLPVAVRATLSWGFHFMKSDR